MPGNVELSARRDRLKGYKNAAEKARKNNSDESPPGTEATDAPEKTRNSDILPQSVLKKQDGKAEAEKEKTIRLKMETPQNSRIKPIEKKSETQPITAAVKKNPTKPLSGIKNGEKVKSDKKSQKQLEKQPEKKAGQKSDVGKEKAIIKPKKTDDSSKRTQKKAIEEKNSKQTEKSQPPLKKQDVKTTVKKQTSLKATHEKSEDNADKPSKKMQGVKKTTEEALNACFTVVAGIYDKYFANGKVALLKEDVLAGLERYVASLVIGETCSQKVSPKDVKALSYVFGNEYFGAGKPAAEAVKSALNEAAVIPSAIKMAIATDVHFKRNETVGLLNEIYRLYSAVCSILASKSAKHRKELFGAVIKFAAGQGLKIE